MSTKRTEQEIKRQIEGLENEKKKLPEFSKFGDANWEKIDAQILVLKGEKKPDDYYQDENADEYEDGDNDIWSAAEEAEGWLLGHNKEDLFDTEE